MTLSCCLLVIGYYCVLLNLLIVNLPLFNGILVRVFV